MPAPTYIRASERLRFSPRRFLRALPTLLVDRDAVQYRHAVGCHGYAVGTDGSVWSALKPGGYVADSWKLLNPLVDKLGYLYVQVGAEPRPLRKPIWRKVHQLVLEAFIGPCPSGMEARHFPDKTPSNNHLENLSWTTPEQNQADKKTQGSLLGLRGGDNGNAVINDDIVREMRVLRRIGISPLAISARFGMSRSTVYAVTNGRAWRHVR